LCIFIWRLLQGDLVVQSQADVLSALNQFHLFRLYHG
jgi:hypothetical protein